MVQWYSVLLCSQQQSVNPSSSENHQNQADVQQDRPQRKDLVQPGTQNTITKQSLTDAKVKDFSCVSLCINNKW